jgi:hypothetical protein
VKKFKDVKGCDEAIAELSVGLHVLSPAVRAGCLCVSTSNARVAPSCCLHCHLGPHPRRQIR